VYISGIASCCLLSSVFRCLSFASLPSPRIPSSLGSCSLTNQRHVFFLQHCDNFLFAFSHFVSLFLSYFALLIVAFLRVFASLSCFLYLSISLLAFVNILVVVVVVVAVVVAVFVVFFGLPCFCVKCLICLSKAERMQPLRKYVQPV